MEYKLRKQMLLLVDYQLIVTEIMSL